MFSQLEIPSSEQDFAEFWTILQTERPVRPLQTTSKINQSPFNSIVLTVSLLKWT